MSTTTTDVAIQPRQESWLKALLWERGIDGEPKELAPTAGEASALINRFLRGEIGTVQPITEEQAEQIRTLQSELGPRVVDGEELADEMPTDRAGATKLLRALRRVKYARADEAVLERLRAKGVTVNVKTNESTGETTVVDDIPF